MTCVNTKLQVLLNLSFVQINNLAITFLFMYTLYIVKSNLKFSWKHFAVLS